jgi:hypothetical protein
MDLGERLLNPTVLLTMVIAGIAYGWLLWAFRVRPTFTLWATALFPGAIFLIVLGSVRFAQGTPSLVWPALLVDWLVFASSGFLVVLIGRWWIRRRMP